MKKPQRYASNGISVIEQKADAQLTAEILKLAYLLWGFKRIFLSDLRHLSCWSVTRLALAEFKVI